MNNDLLPTATDAELVDAIAARDESALAEVFKRHGQAVLGLARRLLSDPTLAEDMTQEIFVRLWNEPTRFDPHRGKLRTLLLTQTHGLAVDNIRSRNARRRREERVTYEAPPHSPDVDAAIMALTTAEQVRAALATLPTDERTAIELAYFGANTYRQVAELLGVPEGTIKTRIRTGLRRLHVAIADPNGEPSQGSETTTNTDGLKGRP